MEDINLHFTGDFNAIQLANNLLAAMLDNHIHHGNELGIDVRRITWKRVLDMNDRALRDIVVSLGGPGNGYPRQDGFDIVVASRSDGDLLPGDLARRPEEPPRQHRRRLHARPEAGARARPEGARRDDGAAQGRAQAQSRADAGEQSGVHPRRPVRQHRARLQLGDRHAERRSSSPTTSSPKPASAPISARKNSSTSSAASPVCARTPAVIVATVRALKYHGGVDLKELNKENLAALEKGIANLERHVRQRAQPLSACRAWFRSTISPTTPTPRLALIREMAHGKYPRGAGAALGRRRQGRRRAGA